MKVGWLVVMELQQFLAIEEVNTQGDTDTVGGVLDIEDLGLGILEAALGDDNGIEIFDVLERRTEGETLLVLATEGDKGGHHRIGHGDTMTVMTDIAVHMEMTFTVPGTGDETGNLLVAGLDEHEIMHGATQVVTVTSVTFLVGEVLGIRIGNGLGKEHIRNEIFEKTQMLSSAFLVFELELTLDELGFEVDEDIPGLIVAYDVTFSHA